MEKAKKNEFSGMTLEEARKLPLDGKKDEKTGKFTSLTLKRGLISDDGKIYVERRIFRNADMQDVVLYDLPIPLVESEFNKIPFSERLDHYAKSIRVYTDGVKAGKGQADPIASGIKNLDKIVSTLVAKGVPQAEAEKAVASARKQLLASGFGK